MKIYQRIYRHFLIRVEKVEDSDPSLLFQYHATGYNPVTGEHFRSTGSSDTEALHKLRGKIDHSYGKTRLSGN